MDNNNNNDYLNEITLEPETTSDFGNPVLAEYQTEDEQQHWCAELVASRKEREKFNKRGVETIKRYADERETSSKAAHYNVFYANVDTKMASLFARTPQPDIKRRFNEPEDQIGRVAALVLERNLSYELETEEFDSKFKQMLFDRLVPGVGIGWARIDQKEGDPDFDEITGLPIGGSHIKSQLADIDYVAWNDFVWAPCRVWNDCLWVGRRIAMSKSAIKERFGATADKMMLATLVFSMPDSSAPQVSTESTRPTNMTVETVDVYEIWDKARGLIFWISEGCNKPLDVQLDTNEFPGFFPTPLPPMCRTTTSSTTPISDFSLVQDLYNELDNLNNRIANLVRALQVKFTYDSSNEALKTLFTSASELEGVPVKDWAANMSDKGGITQSMQFVPLQETAQVYSQLVQARDMVKQQIMEIEGISDFQRGVAQPYVTAAASQATSQASSGRVMVAQMEVAGYIQRLLRLKAHLICKFYTPQTIMSRIGQLSQADMQYVQQALQRLQDEQLRHYTLEVSVDSIQQPNWNQENADKTAAIQAFTALMGQIASGAQQTPQMLPLGIAAAKWLVTGFKGAQTLEGTIDAYLDQFMQQAAQQQQTPPQPSPQQLKFQGQQAQIQSDQAIAQQQAQVTLQVAQIQAQNKQLQAQIDLLTAQTKAKQVDAVIARDQAHTHMDAVEGAHNQAMDVAGLGVQ